MNQKNKTHKINHQKTLEEYGTEFGIYSSIQENDAKGRMFETVKKVKKSSEKKAENKDKNNDE